MEIVDMSDSFQKVFELHYKLKKIPMENQNLDSLLNTSQ